MIVTEREGTFSVNEKFFVQKKKKKSSIIKKCKCGSYVTSIPLQNQNPLFSYRTINTKSVNSNLRYAERCKEPFFFVFAWNKGILSLQEKKDYNNKEKEKHLKNTLKDTR